MADKQFLEASFPSLQEDVVPVEKYAHLSALELEDDQIVVKDSAQAINDIALSILDSIPDGENSTIAVGFDTEWNVDLSQQQRGAGQRATAIIQLAYGKQVYILQVCELFQ